LHDNFYYDNNQAYSKYKHLLTFRIRRYVVISNETRALIANLSNIAQLEGTSYHSPKLGMWQGTDRQTHRWPWPKYLSPRLCL